MSGEYTDGPPRFFVHKDGGWQSAHPLQACLIDGEPHFVKDVAIGTEVMLPSDDNVYRLLEGTPARLELSFTAFTRKDVERVQWMLDKFQAQLKLPAGKLETRVLEAPE